MRQETYQFPRKRQFLCGSEVGSAGEVLVKTEFLGLAEINHAHAERIKQSIYESFEIGM